MCLYDCNLRQHLNHLPPICSMNAAICRLQHAAKERANDMSSKCMSTSFCLICLHSSQFLYQRIFCQNADQGCLPCSNTNHVFFQSLSLLVFADCIDSFCCNLTHRFRIYNHFQLRRSELPASATGFGCNSLINSLLTIQPSHAKHMLLTQTAIN